MNGGRAPLRGAIVGYGFIASHGHLPAYRSLPGAFEIVAVADPCSARRARAREALPGVRIYEDHVSLLEAEGRTLDFVDVATPPIEHARIARAALGAGLHVFCEKPVATSSAELEAVLHVARAQGRVFFPSHNYKYAPVVSAVNEVVASGTLGAVRLVTLQTFRTGHARGVEEWRPDWRRERRWAGGGIALDHGAHSLYLAFDWLRSYPAAVTAKASVLGPFDTEDNVSCSLTFPEGLATAELTWTASFRKVLYTLHGDRGALRVEDDDIELTTSRPGADGHVVVRDVARRKVASDWNDPGHPEWFAALFEAFARAVHGEADATREVDDARAATEVIGAIYASAANGSREVALTARPRRRG